MGNKEHLQVFEHQALTLDQEGFEAHHLMALQQFYGQKGSNLFTLINNGVKFCEFVGVMRVGRLTIEILPKIDRDPEDDIGKWQRILVAMLKEAGLMKVHAPTLAHLNLHSNSILDLYLEMFIYECEGLVHKGLIKKYRKDEGNQLAIKGAINFSRHLSCNFVHKERFHVRYTTYDMDHLLNQLLFQALLLVRRINTSPLLSSRISSLLLNFPEVQTLRVDKDLFSRIKYDRKSEPYREAISIAKLLLLNLHPDVTIGAENVFAIMFDMNRLWEAYVYRTLLKLRPEGVEIKGQQQEDFWESGNGHTLTVRPDIVIEKSGKIFIVDTKWKLPKADRPTDNDLKQMFVYNYRFKASKSILLYPGRQYRQINGTYYDDLECSLIFAQIEKDGKLVQDDLKIFLGLLNLEKD